MPIISRIGRRSIKVRIAIGLIYTLLILGAVSMIYPLSLMLAGSVKGEADIADVSPWPAFLGDDKVLWRRYLESKYGPTPEIDLAFRRSVGSLRKIERPAEPNADQARLVEEFHAFRAQSDWPDHWFSVGHAQYTNLLAKNARHFRGFLRDRYDGDVGAYSRDVQVSYASWSQVGPPVTGMLFATRRFSFPRTPNFLLFYEFKRAVPRHDRVPMDPDALFWQTFLLPSWSNVRAYNQAHGTDHADYRDVLLTDRAPPATLGNGKPRADWESFVRGDLGLAFIRIDDSALPAFRAFLRQRYAGSTDDFRRMWIDPSLDFDTVKFPDVTQAATPVRNDLAAFLKDAEACPTGALSVYGPRQAFEAFVAARRGVTVESITPLPLPTELSDHADFLPQRGDLRWEFVTRNYKTVLEYVLLNGRGIRNTVIYCSLMVLASLIVNPLAAYALSRYKPPTTYHVLLLCMATMAFPGEVTMIPSFLLLKRFPLGFLLVGMAAAAGAIYLSMKLRPAWSDTRRGLLGLVVGCVAGWWLAPLLAGWVFGVESGSVSLLNTFWALILPGMANGFSIFLLKGFFDSLPRELFEAADLDGATEWHKFWIITMNLSKPILAVIALGAFTAAYSEFLMALVIIPDQNMWTIMVWLFQLQSWSHGSVVYASLVIAAIPTMLVFLFCQNLIMRGIVVPTEK